ncbi:MAG: cytochrome b/b6 domain-containing protein [Candidatus Thiodiazotropha sp.]
MPHNVSDSATDITSKHQDHSRVFVWDIPVRLFHWTLVALMISLVVTAKMPIDVIEPHAKLGFAVLALVSFRLLWGFVGSSYARFSQFVRGPGAVIAYTRSMLAKQDGFVAGHNPQVLLGMFSNDDILFDGPLAYLISKDTSDLITGLHKDMFDILLVLVGLHVTAVIWHKLFRGENLLYAMFTGYKELLPGVQVENAHGGGIVLALIMLIITWRGLLVGCIDLVLSNSRISPSLLHLYNRIIKVCGVRWIPFKYVRDDRNPTVM